MDEHDASLLPPGIGMAIFPGVIAGWSSHVLARMARMDGEWPTRHDACGYVLDADATKIRFCCLMPHY